MSWWIRGHEPLEEGVESDSVNRVSTLGVRLGLLGLIGLLCVACGLVPKSRRRGSRATKAVLEVASPSWSPRGLSIQVVDKRVERTESKRVVEEVRRGLERRLGAASNSKYTLRVRVTVLEVELVVAAWQAIARLEASLLEGQRELTSFASFKKIFRMNLYGERSARDTTERVARAAMVDLSRQIRAYDVDSPAAAAAAGAQSAVATPAAQAVAPPEEPSPRVKAPTGKRIAVLELGAKNIEGLTPEALASISDIIRQLALQHAPHYEIITRENLLMLLESQGSSLEQCSEAECEVELGRMIGADLVVSGAISKIGSKLFMTVKVHDTARGNLLGAQTAKAKNIDGLMDQLEELTERLFVPL